MWFGLPLFETVEQANEQAPSLKKTKPEPKKTKVTTATDWANKSEKTASVTSAKFVEKKQRPPTRCHAKFFLK